jgi:hypothetical protein
MAGSFLFTFWMVLPWVAIAMVAGLAWRKRTHSTSLLLQAGGAAAIVVLAVAQWVIVRLLLEGLGARASFVSAGNIIFGFLLFVALCTFAAGYCAERFARRKPEEAAPLPQKPA